MKIHGVNREGDLVFSDGCMEECVVMSERREAPEPSAWRTKGGAVFPGQAWHDDEPLYTLDVVAEMLEEVAARETAGPSYTAGDIVGYHPYSRAARYLRQRRAEP